MIYVTIEEQTINPTNEQALACVRVCQMLSKRKILKGKNKNVS
ncbi:DUF6888 family protein [Nostoc sp.]